jgi:two-component system sensor histidine kinase VicK
VLLTVIVGLLLVGAGLAYATMRVVNELRRLYAEQQETTEKLAAANKAKADFIADVSHELRTPLTVLRGNAQVGLLDGGGEHKEILEEIVEESKRMSRMVEDLLFLAKSDSASLRLTFETVAVEPFVAELAGRAEILARERGATLETELRGEGLLRIDPQRIEQAALILVDNAAKYSQPGGKLPTPRPCATASCASRSRTVAPAYQEKSCRASSSASTASTRRVPGSWGAPGWVYP